MATSYKLNMRTMKTITAVFFLFLLSCVLGSAQKQEEEKKTVSLKPQSLSKVVLINSAGNARQYYALSQSSPCIVSIEGPGELRVLTRVRLYPKTIKSADYRLTYRRDGGSEQAVEFSRVGQSDTCFYVGDTLGTPAQIRDFRIYLNKGRHSLHFRLSDSTHQVAARFLYTVTKAKPSKWYPLAPLAPVEPVDLIANEQTSHHYRFSSTKPLRVEVIGPSTLRILTRIENSYYMEGSIDYRIQVKTNGSVLNTYQLSSARSEVAAYRDDPKLVPGKAREIVITVPKGRHLYEIAPPLDDKCTVLAQIFFPQKDSRTQQ
jgi:hypothetical protein